MRKIVLAALLWLAAAVPALAQNCAAYPFTFTANTTIRSAQVNSNFTSILNCANTNLAPLASPTFTGVLSAPTVDVTSGLTSGNLVQSSSGGQLVDSGLVGVSVWSTGDVKMTMKTTADTGWVFMNDGTIGDASSGGTTRANADTSALFTLLWTNCANAQCPVSTGRGGSAAADFAAHKTINLPLALGRALASAGAGSGLTSRVLGATTGAETATIAQANLPNVSFPVTDPGHQHNESGSGTAGATLLNTAGNGTANTNTNSPTTVATTGITVNSGGSGTALGIMQPSTFINVEIKL